jgi:hypothetical protein
MSETTQVTKHNVWIGIDKNNYIIRIYNDAFMIPLEGDYQLSTVEHTDTEINGAKNPSLFDSTEAHQGCHNYKFNPTDKTVTVMTDVDKNVELLSFPKTPPTTEQILQGLQLTICDLYETILTMSNTPTT